ncbi:DEAD/DEAH box helicase [bacterium]|nr:DEAD/DEAH box helicase [bacterium]
MTPVQEQAIPMILEGKDCLAEAPTGTGKTFAFGLPAIENTDVNTYTVQTIILCPTRELAMQIESELLKLTTYTEGIRILAIYGGQPIEKQLYKLRKKPQIIVGTPGRVMDHIRRKTLRLENVKTVVLDEADEMLNMGFRTDIDTILSSMPSNVGMQLFSATIPKEILEISREYQHEPVRIKAPCQTSALPNIEQYFIKVTEDSKFDALKAVMSQKDYHYVLVFCNTKRRVGTLDEKLNKDGYLSMALHGDLQQRQRDTVMRNYRDKKINILVATDVAARGIDVADIEAVINYDLPNNEDY